ncbi:MAG: ATP-binding protein [Cyanobacteria bacterium J06592_8]
MNSKQLQRLLIFYSAAGIFTISILIAVISIFPLYKQLRTNEEQNLQSALHTRKLAVEEFLSRAKDVAAQVASRTQAKRELEAYNRSQDNRETAVSNVTRILNDALNQTDDVAGITRLDQNNQLMVQVGIPIPQTLWIFPVQGSQNSKISNPVYLNNQPYLIVTQPILNANQQQIGTDLVLFKKDNLRRIITDTTGLGQTVEVFLGLFQNQKIQLFLASQPETKTSREEIVEALEEAVIPQDSGIVIVKPKPSSNAEVIAFEVLSKTNWKLIITIDNQELYATVNNQLITLGFFTIILSLLGAGGMVLLLRPLAGRVIIETSELEQQLQEKKQTLEELNSTQDQLLLEISDREKTEIALRESEAELKDQKQQLQHTLQELQRTQVQMIQNEKMSSLGQMVAGIAHEINNPISFIHGNVAYADEYIQDLVHVIELYQTYSPHPDPELKEKLEEIELDFIQEDLQKILKSMKVGTERIREIVKSLRIFSRLDEAEIKDIDLHEGLESTLMILQSHLKDQPEHLEIQVIKEYDQNLPHITCYPGQLNQVFMNLISNGIDAIKEAQSDGEILENVGYIQIKTQQIDENWVQISITDNGKGIPEEVQACMFNPFFTTKPIGQGTGLGLSISYQIIVDKHHGKLECDSERGKGTKFTIKIPISLKNYS